MDGQGPLELELEQEQEPELEIGSPVPGGHYHNPSPYQGFIEDQEGRRTEGTTGLDFEWACFSARLRLSARTPKYECERFRVGPQPLREYLEGSGVLCGERDKLWHKAQACSDPAAAMCLLAKLGYKLHLSPGKKAC